jgi:hypothetical protein
MKYANGFVEGLGPVTLGFEPVEEFASPDNKASRFSEFICFPSSRGDVEKENALRVLTAPSYPLGEILGFRYDTFTHTTRRYLLNIDQYLMALVL